MYQFNGLQLRHQYIHKFSIDQFDAFPRLLQITHSLSEYTDR